MRKPGLKKQTILQCFFINMKEITFMSTENKNKKKKNKKKERKIIDKKEREQTLKPYFSENL